MFVDQAMGQTTRRCIAYGAQFQSTISVMRAHNSDWTRVSKALDASKTSSLVEVPTVLCVLPDINHSRAQDGGVLIVVVCSSLLR